MHWRATCKILTTFFKAGMLPLSIPARGFMLHATVITVWPVCKFICDFLPVVLQLFAYMVNYLFVFGQWSWKCRSFWSTGFTTWSTYKFAVLVSYESYMILLSKLDSFLSIMLSLISWLILLYFLCCFFIKCSYKQYLYIEWPGIKSIFLLIATPLCVCKHTLPHPYPPK